MKLDQYLNPPADDVFSYHEGEIGKQVVAAHRNFSNVVLQQGDIVLIGLPFQIDTKLELMDSPNLVRKELYALALPNRIKGNLYDLGDLKQGRNIKETLYILIDLLTLLREFKTYSLLIGGPDIFNLSVLKTMESQVQGSSFTIVEPYFSLAQLAEFNLVDFAKIRYTNLGSQTYYLDDDQNNWMESNQYESFRLGRLRGMLSESEPLLRDSDGCSISVNALKHSDAPGQEKAYPNGLYSEEICQLARYAGLSNKLSIFGVYNYSPENDPTRVTAKLIAQIFWFAIEGFLLRCPEHPYSDDHFKKFIVSLENHKLTFYWSERTSRWWMEIPVDEGEKNQVFPCNQSDYDAACRHELPARWLFAYQKLNFKGENT